MPYVYLTVIGNLEPSIEITLKRKKQPIPLDGSTVYLIIQNPNTKEITNTGHQECTITDDVNSVISYEVEEGDITDPSIDYLAEVSIVYSNGRPEIIYDQFIISPRPQLTPTTVS